jgi:hypothetical protein
MWEDLHPGVEIREDVPDLRRGGIDLDRLDPNSFTKHAGRGRRGPREESEEARDRQRDDEGPSDPRR